MKKISLDNGRTYITADEAMPEINKRRMWSVVVQMMDDDTRERVHRELAPCTGIAFLRRYLELTDEDLIIG